MRLTSIVRTASALLCTHLSADAIWTT